MCVGWRRGGHLTRTNAFTSPSPTSAPQGPGSRKDSFCGKGKPSDTQFFEEAGLHGPPLSRPRCDPILRQLWLPSFSMLSNPIPSHPIPSHPIISSAAHRHIICSLSRNTCAQCRSRALCSHQRVNASARPSLKELWESWSQRWRLLGSVVLQGDRTD